MEYYVVLRLQESPTDRVPDTLTIILFSLNISELLMELALYVVFIRVLCILRKFLNSFDPEAMPEYE